MVASQTTAWTYGLVTVQRARDFLSTSPTQDTELSETIRAASQRIRRLCGRDEDDGFESTERTEEYDWPLSGEQYPREWPVTAIDSIVERYGTDSSTTLDTDHYEIVSSGRAIRFWQDSDIRFYTGQPPHECRNGIRLSRTRRVRITYTGGYTTPPYDLQRIALDYIAHLWVGKGQSGAYVSENLGSYGYTRRTPTEMQQWLLSELGAGGWINGSAVL